ncbi:hypothetical protein QW131_24715 [Roseibium salinum]|nr:hypothetical protein [Roseibium salinum]
MQDQAVLAFGLVGLAPAGPNGLAAGFFRVTFRFRILDRVAA